MKTKYQTIIVLTLILVLQIALRIPFLQEPLERDEGAYAYIAQRMRVGEIPYRDAFDHKPPAVYFVYAGIFELLGESLASIRVFTLFFSLIITLSVFAAGFLLWGRVGGLVSAFLYAVFSGGLYVQGTSANTETFMVLPLVLALICFVAGRRPPATGKGWWFFAAGLFSGTAIMFKQVALFNFLILLLFLFGFENKRLKFDFKNAGWLISGCLVAPLFFSIYFLSRGALSDYIYNAFIINRRYLQTVPGNFFTRMAYGYVTTSGIAKYENSVIWAFGLSGLLYIFFKERSRENLLLAFWGLASFIGVSASGLFYGHYFIQAIPALCLLSAFALMEIKEKGGFYGKAAVLLFSLFFILGILPAQYPFYFKYTPAEISEHKYGNKSFAISYHLAEEFRKFIKPDEKILVWSANPEVYFYLNKKSPTRYFNYLKWMETAEIKEEILSSIFSEEPDYIIWTGYAPGYEKMLSFIRRHYRFYMEVESWKVFKRKE